MKQRHDSFFLPDFCSLRSVLSVVVLSELFAVILTLAKAGSGIPLWRTLGWTSLFMQWAGLTGATVLCYGRPMLVKLGNRAAARVSYGLLLLVIVCLSLVTYGLLLDAGMKGAVGGYATFVLRNLAIGAIVSALILRYFYVTHEARQRLVAESEARLEALQARIRPHFLFNSMNTIASLTRSDPVGAEAAIEDLADLFRASLGEGRGTITLAEELDLTRRYLHMEQLRLGDRLAVEWRLEGVPEDARIPPLTLQPLVENAIYHGIEPLAGGGIVVITGAVDGEGITLAVTNPVAEGRSERVGNRIAVDNVRQRLAHHFGAQGGLTAEPTDGHYRVQLHIPYRQEPT